MSPCPICGDAVVQKGPGRRRIYCSRPCTNRAFHERRKADGRWDSARKDRDRSKDRVERVCVVCDQAWMTPRRDAKLCSDECRAEFYRGQSSVCPLATDHPARWFGALTPIRFGACGWCDQTMCLGRNAARTYCSERCGARARDKRRRVARGEFAVNPNFRLGIYERDGWTCQLCRGVVDRDAHFLDPWSPTLDHIIPQSATDSPDHGPSNLRLAHRWCNAVRGDGSRDLTALFAV